MKKYFMCFCFLLIGNSLFAQKRIITLWEDTIPGAIKSTVFKPLVETPTLEIYQARGKSRHAAVIICPGGAYWGLALNHEGTMVAEWFNRLNITAFVLKYRIPNDSIMRNKTIGPLQDAQKAIRLVRSRAAEWNIDPNKIGIMGFSAGGHLASTLSTHYMDKVYNTTDTTSARPDFSILVYPVISMDSSITHWGSRENLLGKKPSNKMVDFYSNEKQVNKKTPSAFLVHSINDELVPVENSINYALALKKFSIPCELHIYQSGGHGYGLGKSKNTEISWPDACEKWLKAKGIIESK